VQIFKLPEQLLTAFHPPGLLMVVPLALLSAVVALLRMVAVAAQRGQMGPVPAAAIQMELHPERVVEAVEQTEEVRGQTHRH